MVVGAEVFTGAKVRQAISRGSQDDRESNGARVLAILKESLMPRWGTDRQMWCSGQDSNLHALRHTPLKRVCLPIPPPEHFHEGRRTKRTPPHLVKPGKLSPSKASKIRKCPTTCAVDRPANERVPVRERALEKSFLCRFESDLRLHPSSRPHSQDRRSRPLQ